MRPTRRLAAGVLTALLAAGSPLGASIAPQRSPDTATTSAWRQDLRYLVTELARRHRNLYHTVSKVAFDSAVADLDRRIPRLGRAEVLVGLARLVGMVGDGHTVLPLPIDSAAGFRRFPVHLYRFAEGIHVQAAARPHARIVGGRLVRIGRGDAEAIYRAVAQLTGRDNEMTTLERAPAWMPTAELLQALGFIDDPERAEIVVEVNGRAISDTLAPWPGPGPRISAGGLATVPEGWVDAAEGAVTPLWLKRPHDPFWFEYDRTRSLLYIQYNGVQNKPEETVARFFARAFAFADSQRPARVVLDVRQNGGGNNVLNRAVIRAVLGSTVAREQGRFFTLIGRGTFSAAQNLVNDLDTYSDAVFVGEPTGGSPNHYGDHVAIRLPRSGVVAFASTVWWQDIDPRDPRRWIAPRVAVELQADDYRRGRDPALEAVLGYSASPPLSQQLLEALDRGGVAGVLERHRRYKADPRHRYISTEAEVNALGYRLLEQRRVDQAIMLFRLNVEDYPESWNTYDSLGEAYALAGQIGPAIESYEKSLRINPENHNGVERLTRLRR